MYKFLLLAAMLLLVAACGKPPAPQPETVRLVKVLEVTAQTPVSALLLAGEVRARYESPLAFQVGGKVVERAVNLGERSKPVSFWRGSMPPTMSWPRAQPPRP